MTFTREESKARLRRGPTFGCRARAAVRALLVTIGITACESPQDANDSRSPTERYQAAMDTVADLDDAIQLIDSWEVGRDGVDGRLLEERRSVRAGQRRALLWRLADLAPQLSDDQGDGADAALLDSLLLADAEELWEEMSGWLREASRLGAEAPTLQGAARVRAEDRIHELDRSIDDGLLAIFNAQAARESVGVDVSDSYLALDRVLEIRAELLAGRMARAEQEIVDLRNRMRQGVTGLEEEVVALNLEVDKTAGSLQRVLTLMEDRELPTDGYRRYLLVSTGSLTTQNLNWDVVRGLAADWVDQVLAWFAESGLNVLLHVFVFVATLALARLLAAAVNRLVVRGLKVSRLELSNLMRETLTRWSTRLVMLLGLLIALSQIGVELSPVLAGLGVAGFIVGFALQDTLANFAAGVMILLYRPFDVDDLVVIGGVTGKVADMSLVSTTIRSVDNQRYFIPNSQIWGNVIQNVTAEDLRRVDLVFGIGYEDDIPEAERILQEILADHDLVLDEPQSTVKLSELGESSVQFVVRPWCKTSDYWDVRFDITRTVKMRFDEAGISIPFPQRDVHLYHSGGSEVAVGGAEEFAAGAMAAESGSGRVGGILSGEAGEDEADNTPD